TAHSRAISSKRDPARRISSFSNQGAVFRLSDFRELEQTSSAKSAVWCARVERTGRISHSSTATLRRAHCHAASEPARPAPITRTTGVTAIANSQPPAPARLRPGSPSSIHRETWCRGPCKTGLPEYSSPARASARQSNFPAAQSPQPGPAAPCQFLCRDTGHERKDLQETIRLDLQRWSSSRRKAHRRQADRPIPPPALETWASHKIRRAPDRPQSPPPGDARTRLIHE